MNLTAIQWLIEQCPRIETIASQGLIEQAKELEKKQIIEARVSSPIIPSSIDIQDYITEAEKYYNAKYQ